MPWRPSRVTGDELLHVVNQLFRETNGRIDDIVRVRPANTQLKTTTGALTFGAIAAQTAVERTAFLKGASRAGIAHVSPAGALGNVNLIWSAYVSQQDQVTIRLANPTAAAITPNNVTWNIFVLQ